MKLTGERPLEGKTPDSLLALHAAGYREVAARLGPGRLLDVGCGVGDASAAFLAPEREVVGADYDAPTCAVAGREHPGLATVCSDGARLAVRARTFDYVCSSHLIEHFVAPEGHVAELARVLAPGGAAFVITPNAPADFENPFHVHPFEPADLAALLGRHFEDVEIHGLDGDALVKADFERRRRVARKLLALDVFDLRHRLPHRWYVALHGAGRRVAYPVFALAGRRRRQQATAAGAPAAVTAERFALTAAIDPATLVLFAVARRPRRVGQPRAGAGG